MTLATSELGQEAGSALRDLNRRASTGRTVTMLMAEDLTSTWQTLADGWTDIGVREDGEGATRFDLVEIGRAWGESCLPLPFTTTLLAKRWSAAAREHDGPIALSVARRGQSGGTALFGDLRGVHLATELGDGATAPLVSVPAVTDTLGPSLRLGTVDRKTTMSPEAAEECRLVWAAEAVGAATRSLQEAVSYAKLRTQFGKPIGSFQAVKHHLANAHIALEQAETALLWAAAEPGGAPGALDYAFTAARTVCELGIQVHGGVGFTWELGLHFYLRHIMALAEVADGLQA